MIGDNCNNSEDSRFVNIGAVSKEDLEGVDTLQLEFDKENNCLMSVNNEILSHTMD